MSLFNNTFVRSNQQAALLNLQGFWTSRCESVHVYMVPIQVHLRAVILGRRSDPDEQRRKVDYQSRRPSLEINEQQDEQLLRILMIPKRRCFSFLLQPLGFRMLVLTPVLEEVSLQRAPKSPCGPPLPRCPPASSPRRPR